MPVPQTRVADTGFCRNMRQNARCPAKANITPTPLHPPSRQRSKTHNAHNTTERMERMAIFFILLMWNYIFFVILERKTNLPRH